MEYSFIIAVIPIILVVAFIVWIAKKISAGERLDMKEGVVGVVILLVAVLVMVPMVSSTQVYMWNPDSGELTIQQNISGGAYAWDTYDDQIRSIVIKPGVNQIGNSAFDGATNLEYLSIPDTVTDIGANAFGVVLKDPYDQTLTAGAGVFAGFGDGTLYKMDESILTVTGSKVGLTASAKTDALNVVVPESIDGVKMDTILSQGFSGSVVKNVVIVGNSMETLDYRAFYSSSLERIAVPASAHYIGGGAFSGCSSLESLELGALTYIGGGAFSGCSSLESISWTSGPASILNNAFQDCSSLTSISIPEGVTSIGAVCFYRCTSLSEVVFPDSLTALDVNVFSECSGITSIRFGTGLTTVASNSFGTWKFYASDGTTQIDKTDASNLAGKTFQGTAAALVEVTPGLLSLTPQQLQQVHLHDAELQDLKDHLTIDPLPFQPSVQTEDPVAA